VRPEGFAKITNDPGVLPVTGVCEGVLLLVAPSANQELVPLALNATYAMVPEDAVTLMVVLTAVVLPTVALSVTDAGLTLRVWALAMHASEISDREVMERTLFKI
jgi:hypothetical protein